MSTNKKIVPIKYTARDFSTIKAELVDYAKRYYSDSFKDFNEAGFGALMLDTVSYIGDVLSFYVDYNTNESHLKTSIEFDNILKHGYKLGYKYNPFASSTGIVTLYCVLPALSNGLGPDYSYAPILKQGTIFSAGPSTFLLSQDVNMAKPVRIRNASGVISNYDPLIRVAKTDATTGIPTHYALKTYGSVISGVYRTYTETIGAFKKYTKVTISDSNISDIISIVDSDGNEYIEVDYLSQNIVYKSLPSTTADSSLVQSILVPVAAPRRFIIQRFNQKTEIVFGASSNLQVENDQLLEDPTKFVSQIYGRKYVADDSFDPYKLLNSDKYGIGPSNTTLTITYKVNTVDNVNASAGAVNTVSQLNAEFVDRQNLNQIKINDVLDSIIVENEDPIVGDVTIPTTDELKIRIMDHYATQHRAVTELDYEATCYSMPAEYGALKRVKIVKDQQSFKRNLNLYVLAEDADGHFTAATTLLKKNLKTWLNKNKVISDTIDIIDAKILNLAIDFDVIGMSNVPKHQVLTDCLEAIKALFINKPMIGQPFFLNDVMLALKKVDSVLDVKDIRVYKKTGSNYSAISLNVDSSIGSCRTPDESSIEIPLNVIWEIKYPDSDINGNVF